MKSIFSRTKKEVPAQQTPVSFIPATRTLRADIIQFVVQSLQPFVDEKSLSVAGLHLYVFCDDRQQEEAVQAALYADKTGLFKTEQLERILANHFISLAPGWVFEYHIVKELLPPDCLQQGRFGLKIATAGAPVSVQYIKAGITILAGQAAYDQYELDPGKQLKFYIGRSRTPQLASGKIQQNDIVFLGSNETGSTGQTGHANLHVSRNHAFIVYEPGTGRYLLYPDKGGLPDSGNKLKVHTADDKVKWLNIYGVAHCLQNGDQVELGGSAVFRFTLL